MDHYGNKKNMSVLCLTKYVHRVINYNEKEVCLSYQSLQCNAMHLLYCDD